MSQLTICIVVRNNEDTIEKTLESILPLESHILIGDIGCTDSTIDKCKRYGTEVIRYSLNNDLSQVRNHMLKQNRWHLYIEPWENLLTGQETIQNTIYGPPGAYKLGIIQGDVITKQIRLWHSETGLKFTNPVFETLTGDAHNLDAYISANGANSDSSLYSELVVNWRENYPLATAPIYYTACTYLRNKNWESFLNFAEIYLHQEKSDAMSVFMTRYYCAMVNCYIKKDYHKAIQFLLPCIYKRPSMSEYWCLLADVYYATKNYDQAISFYENALIMGEMRLNHDDWPLEISKYKEYPIKMIDSCKKITQSLRLYGTPIQ